MHYIKKILESGNKVKAVWKTVKKETGKESTEKMTPSIDWAMAQAVSRWPLNVEA
jgi:hypothetical protein